VSRPEGDLRPSGRGGGQDSIPTNCVADWVCSATTGRGCPKYANTPLGEEGYYNLAVFYGACSLDCLYCQTGSIENTP